MCSLDEPTSTALLSDLPAEADVSTAHLLLAALVRALAHALGTGVISIDVEHHGRDERLAAADLTRTVGWFTAVTPVFLTLSPGEPPGQTVAAVEHRMRELPGHGLGWGLAKYAGPVGPLADRLADVPTSSIAFNYFGRTGDGLAQAALFQLSRRAPGPLHGPRNHRPYSLELSASVSGDRIHLTLVYGSRRHAAARIERLLETIVAETRGIADALRAPGDASADPTIALTDDELERLLSDVPGTDDES